MIAIDLTTTRLHLEQVADEPSNEMFFDASARFAKSMQDLVNDEILENALLSSYWRFVRRRIVDHKGNFNRAKDELIKIIKEAEYASQNGDGEKLLLMVCATIEEILKVPESEQAS